MFFFSTVAIRTRASRVSTINLVDVNFTFVALRAVVGLQHTPCLINSVVITFFGEHNDGDSRSSLADNNAT